MREGLAATSYEEMDLCTSPMKTLGRRLRWPYAYPYTRKLKSSRLHAQEENKEAETENCISGKRGCDMDFRAGFGFKETGGVKGAGKTSVA